MAREREAGVALNAIARRLNEDAIPTSQGGKQWYASTVRAVLARLPDAGAVSGAWRA